VAEKLSEAQLEAILAQQIELAKSHDKAERATARDKALDYYFGNMDKYVPPETNRSKVVSRDVADTIGWLMPEFMRIYTASGRMFVAEPSEEEDLEYSDQVTDGLNYVFWKENEGYQIVYNGTWDALMHGDGIVKTFWDETPVYGPAKFHDALTEDERAMLLQDDDVEVMASTTNAPQPQDPAAAMQQPMDMTAGAMPQAMMQPDMQGMMPEPQPTYDMKVRRKKADGKYVVTVIPPEDFLIDADAICLEDAAFKAHWQRKTRSDLIAMGYSHDDVWAIPEASRTETPEAQARRLFSNADATDKSMQLVDYFECFVMVDADGDGEAEMIRACYAGGANGKLLDWEVWEDEDPFDNIPCEPIPHRFGARSVADEEIDVQDVKTVLSRQLLNSVYWATNPQRFAKGKIMNPDQLDNPTFGGTVFGDANATVENLESPPVGEIALAGIQYMDEVSSRRTGVNSQSMALDPETLQNQSATANNNAMAASRSQPELIARNMAVGWGKVGRKLLRLMNKHDGKPRTILVKGKPVQIDPRQWNTDMHVNINTGLGTGSRDKDTMMLGQVLQQQLLYIDRISVAFPEKALEMLKYVHNTVTQFAESGGLRNPELYWPEINDREIEIGKQILAQKAQQPDPAIVLEQTKQQGARALEQTRSQTQIQLKQVDAQLSQHDAELKAQGDVAKNQAELQADLQTKAADRQNAIDLENVKQQGAFLIEQLRIQSQERMKAAELAHQAALEDRRMQNAQTIAAMKPAPSNGAAAN
jgi:hypothetical protein